MNTKLQTKPRTSLGLPKIRDLIYSVLLFFAARASVIGVFPFGIAFYAACFDKSCAYIGILALCAGYMSVQSGIGVVKYIIAALIYWIYSGLKNERNSPVADSAVCGASVLIGGGVMLVYNFLGLYDAVVLVMESIASALMYIIFMRAQNMFSRDSMKHGAGKDELISMAISAGVFITGLDGIKLPFNMGLSRIISVYVIMLMASKLSLTAAGSGGMCVGFMTFMSKTGAPAAMGVYGLAAFFANLLKSFGRFGVALGFLGGAAAAMLYTGSAMPINIQEAMAGAFLYVITPKKFHKLVSSFLFRAVHIEAVDTKDRIKEYLSMQLDRTAQAFNSLSECFIGASDKRLKLYNKEVGLLFDETASRVCDGCKRKSKCWGCDFTKTYRNIMSLLGIIESEGVLEVNALPDDFRDTCVRGGLFVMEFNHVYELYKKNMIRTGEAVASRDLVARQYSETAQIMSRLSRDIEDGFNFLEDAEEEIVSRLSKEGIAVNEISVIESGRGKIEVYILFENKKNIERTEELLGGVFSMPMGACDSVGGVIRFASKPRYSIEAVVKSVSKGRVCGDDTSVFTVGDKRSYVILSDGMGAGTAAAAQSGMTVKLLREFLEAGFGVRNAVSMINSALCLNLDKERFSTVDIFSLDLISGEGDFYKIGSAQSALLHHNQVEVIYSAALPVGMICDIQPAVQSKQLCDGDIVLMMSDGVSEAQSAGVRTNWVGKYLQKNYDNMEELAQTVIEQALERSGGEVNDDMTIAAVRIFEN